VLNVIRRCAENDRILLSEHAKARMAKRQVSYMDICHVLLHGEREEKRDRYDERYRSCSYAVRGMTLNDDYLRVVVAICSPKFLIVTVYYRDEKNEISSCY